MKEFNFILLGVLFHISTFGQNWLWAKSINSSGLDYGSSICTDSQNNIATTGVFTSSVLTFGTYSLTNIGGQNIYISKYDPNGNVLWAKNAGDTGGCYSNCITSDFSGNIFVGGVFASKNITFDTCTISNVGAPGVENGFLVKYDSIGNAVWARSIGDKSDEDITSVSVDVNGNVYIIGNFYSDSLIIGNTVLTNTDQGYSDIFIAKFDNAGNALWAKSAHSSKRDIGRSIITDNKGSVFITGLYGENDFTLGNISLTPNSAYWRFFIAKYDVNGNEIWVRGSSIDYSEGISICTDTSGNAYVTGHFFSPLITFGTITVYNTSSYNTFLTKYDPNGNALWAKSIKWSINKSWSTAIDDNSIYVTGSFGSSLVIIDTYTLTRPNGVSSAMYLVKYDLNGNAICATVTNGGGYDKVGITADKYSNAYITGAFVPSPFLLGPLTLTSSATAYKTIFIAKLTCSDILTETTKITKNIESKIYPNPNNGIFTIENETKSEDCRVVIMNCLGENIYDQICPEKINTININKFPRGIYYCTLTKRNEKILSYKLIVE